MMEKSAEKTPSRQLGTHSKAFKSFKYWALYEAMGGNYFRVSSVIAVTSLCCLIKFNDLKIVLPSFLVWVCSFVSLCLSIFYVMMRKGRLAKRHIALMTTELQKSRPGVSEEAWNQVALELNDQLYHTGVWRSPYFFYDGDDCQNTFRDVCLVPLHKKVASEHSADLEKGASAEQDTNLDQETTNRLCAIAYEDSVRTFFNETIAQEPLQISSEFSVLPRELYSKFYFNIRFLIGRQSLQNTISSLSLLICGWTILPLWIPALFFIVGVWLGVRSDYFEYPQIKFYKLSVPNRVRILTEVMRTKPKSCDVETWDTLAKRANQWLHAQGTWEKSNEFFFDGKEYKESYRRLNHFGTRYVELDSLVQEVKTALETA